MSAFIAAACRSPVVPRGGGLADLSIHALGAPVLCAALQRAGLVPQDVDEVIISNALGAGGNPARSVALAAGLPERVAGLSIDRQCAGGLDAVILARQMIRSGDAEVVVAGGVESYSRRPLRSQTYSDGRSPEPYDQASFTPWPDRDPDMSWAAAQLAKAQNISRDMQDDWAIQSHAKALAYRSTAAELVPLNAVTTDRFTRALTPALTRRAKTIAGSITSANTAVAADAAAFCVVVSERIAKQCTGPIVEVTAGATRGAIPDQPGIAPLAALTAIFAQTALHPNALRVAEVMEAYAVQAIACVQGAGLDPGIVNPGGGALARGHPIGASGAINAVRLYHELADKGGCGIATIAAAGGIGSAVLLRA